MKLSNLLILCVVFVSVLGLNVSAYLTLENKYTARMEVTDLFVDDIDSDGAKEVLATSYDSKLYLLDSNLNLKWKYDARSYVNAVRTINVEGGRKEIVLASANLRLLDLNGSVISKVNTKDPAKKIIISDIDGDGMEDIVVVSGTVRNHVIYVFDNKLELIWQKSFKGDFPWGLGVLDLNGDGTKEVLAAGSQILAYDIAGDMVWSSESEGSCFDLETVDLDLDGSEEVIVGCRPYIKVFSKEGELIWQYKTGGTVKSIEVSDIDGNSKKEIFVGSDKLYSLDAGGNLQWSFNTSDEVYCVATGDLDWDGVEEIVVASKKVFVVDGSGSKQWEYEPYRVSTNVVIKDLDTDNKNDLLVSGADHNVYLFKAREIYVRELESFGLFDEAQSLYDSGRYDEAQQRIDSAIAIMKNWDVGVCKEQANACIELKTRIDALASKTRDVPATSTTLQEVNNATYSTTTTLADEPVVSSASGSFPVGIVAAVVAVFAVVFGGIYFSKRK